MIEAKEEVEEEETEELEVVIEEEEVEEGELMIMCQRDNKMKGDPYKEEGEVLMIQILGSTENIENEEFILKMIDNLMMIEEEETKKEGLMSMTGKEEE